MTLLDLTPELQRTATTNGGEYAGPCPFCGGRDRFRVWPEEGPTGRFWCRGCGKHGDGLQLIRELKGLSFPEALKAWGLSSPLSGNNGHRSERTATGATWEPRQGTTPGEAWADRAGAFLADCQKTLTGASGADCRAFLLDRGLKPETIEAAGLGFNPEDRYESRESWGLPFEMNGDGKPRRVWIPRGLIIPHLVGGHVHRLRIRRPDPGDGPRYVIVSGSASVPMVWGTGPAWVIIESELDGLLLAQEAGHLAGVVSLGSVTNRPDAETDRTLKAADLLLIALDSDPAGASESRKWWKRIYRNGKRWLVPIGKDPSEAFQRGLNLRAWVMAGLLSTASQEDAHATKGINEGNG